MTSFVYDIYPELIRAGVAGDLPSETPNPISRTLSPNSAPFLLNPKLNMV